MNKPKIKTHKLSDRYLHEDWNNFSGAVLQRLEHGAIEYGDTSFKNPIDKTFYEIENECLDIMGWGFILYVKLLALRERLITETYEIKKGKGTK